VTTRERIIDVAATLLDTGGESAVTLRAVGFAAGLSHNAPYKHFQDRSALLGAVATRDFEILNEAFVRAARDRIRPRTKLRRALQVFVEYARDSPARYRLLFSDPEIARHGGDLEAAAMKSFATFASIVGECQRAGYLPQVPTVSLASLVYASAHGLIDLQAGGRMRSEKGFAGVMEGVDLLLKVLAQQPH
jgi:AcrR family transcriptional regulator